MTKHHTHQTSQYTQQCENSFFKSTWESVFKKCFFCFVVVFCERTKAASKHASSFLNTYVFTIHNTTPKRRFQIYINKSEFVFKKQDKNAILVWTEDQTV